jgi:hypothetical protein
LPHAGANFDLENYRDLLVYPEIKRANQTALQILAQTCAASPPATSLWHNLAIQRYGIPVITATAFSAASC